MRNLVARFPQQIEQALQLAEKVIIQKHQYPYRTVLISGLGGSGIGGNFVQTFAGSTCKIPILVNKGYDVPQWVSKHTLAICSSYSGNTEETIAVFEKLLSTGAKIVCVTSGGKLLELAKKHGCDFVQVPGGWSSPRACLGYSIVAQLAVLRGAKLTSGKILQQVAGANRLIVKQLSKIDKLAQTIAKSLSGRTPVIYIGDNMEAVALRWRQQINENAKMLCWHHVLPEMNHNELVGWKNEHPKTAVVWLRNPNDSPKVTQRTDIVKSIIAKRTSSSQDVFSVGKNDVERALYLVHLGDWMSVYLAEYENVDSVEIEVIDYLKAQLAISESKL